jgi:hypothetical protein
MKRFLRGSLLAALSGIALAFALAGCSGGGDDSKPPVDSTPTTVVQPLPLPVPMRLRAATLSRISVEWVPARM